MHYRPFRRTLRKVLPRRAACTMGRNADPPSDPRDHPVHRDWRGSFLNCPLDKYRNLHYVERTARSYREPHRRTWRGPVGRADSPSPNSKTPMDYAACRPVSAPSWTSSSDSGTRSWSAVPWDSTALPFQSVVRGRDTDTCGTLFLVPRAVRWCMRSVRVSGAPGMRGILSPGGCRDKNLRRKIL